MKHYSKILLIISFAMLLHASAAACRCIGLLTIDSLAQLNEYEFIAHVKITGDEDYKNSTEDDINTIGLLRFQILELFKGEKIEKIFEHYKNSSCDMGISIGEEWIFFAKRINGSLSVVACDRNKQYKQENGIRDWKYNAGFNELNKLRALYKHPTKTFQTEKRKEYYPNGQIELEESYVDGKKNGERKIWYPNGILFAKENFINDSLNGKSEWFYPSGQIFDEDFYDRGKHINISRIYYDSAIDQNSKKWLLRIYKTEDSLNFIFKRVQVMNETVYDTEGREIMFKEYSQLGKIKYELIIDPDRNFQTYIYYHPNGNISSIGYYLNARSFGHHQEYLENGLPSKSWDYDENGKLIKEKK